MGHDWARIPARERVLLGAILAATLLPLPFFAHMDFDYLTADTVAGALRPLGDILTRNYPDQSPLNYIVLHFWLMLFGPSHASIGVLNAICGCGALYYCYRWSRLVFGNGGLALASAAVTAFSTSYWSLVWTGRLYPLLLTLTTAGFYYAARYVEERRASDLIWYAVASLAAIHTHFWAFGTVGLTAFYILLFSWNLETARRAVALTFGALVAGSLWQISRARAAMDWVMYQNPQAMKPGIEFFETINDMVWSVPSSLFGLLKNPPAGADQWLQHAFLAITVVLLVLALRAMSGRNRVLVLLYLAVSQIAVMGLVAAAGKIQIEPRYFSFVLPVTIACILAGGWTASRSIVAKAGTVVLGLMVVCDAGYFAWLARGEVAEFTELLRQTATIYQPGDMIAVHPSRVANAQLLSPVPPLPVSHSAALRANPGGTGRTILITRNNPSGQLLKDVRSQAYVLPDKQAGSMIAVPMYPWTDPVPVSAQFQSLGADMPGATLFFGGAVTGDVSKIITAGPFSTQFAAAKAYSTAPVAKEAAATLGLRPPPAAGTSECIPGTPSVCVLTLDLSKASGGIPASALESVRKTRERGFVAVAAIWPDQWKLPSPSAAAAANSLVDAGASAVVGAGAAAGPAWRRGQALVAPWLGSATGTKREETPIDPPDGLVAGLHILANGEVHAALTEVGANGTGPEPWALTVRFPGDAGSEPRLVEDLTPAWRPGGAWVRSDSELRWGIEVRAGETRAFNVKSLGNRIEGFFGAADPGFAQNKSLPARRMEIRVNNELVHSVTGAAEPGWHHFRVDAARLQARPARVAFTFSGPAGPPLHFSARTVAAAGLGAIDGAPERGLSPSVLSFWRKSVETGAAERLQRSRPANYYLKAPSWIVQSYGILEYPTPIHYPPMGGLGALADAEFRKKAAALTPPASPLPALPTSAYRLSDHVRDAVVEFLPYAGAREVCTGWTGFPFLLPGEEHGPDAEGLFRGRWRCGSEPWKTVAQVRQKLAGDLRDAVWLHPRDNGAVQATFPTVPLGDKLEGYFGLTDLAVQEASYPVYVELWAGGRLVFRQNADPKRRGWQPFSIDTRAWRGQSADVAVRVETDKQRWRHFCIEAYTEPARR